MDKTLKETSSTSRLTSRDVRVKTQKHPADQNPQGRPLQPAPEIIDARAKTPKPKTATLQAHLHPSAQLPQSPPSDLFDYFPVFGVTGTITDVSVGTSTVGVTGTVGAGVWPTVTLTG